MNNIVDILLATYNGEENLKQQLDSITTQSFSEWRVIARDDHSSDGSNALLDEYKLNFPDKFHIIHDELGNVGILQNFSLLMQHSTALYMMFCDQDDVWLPDKILLTLNAMKLAENNNGIETPLLVHTDLQVVDAQLNIKAHSFWQYQNLNPRLDAFNRLLMQNTVTGCTVMINRKLLDMALPIPQQAIMHDWWLGLVAAAFGKIVIVEQTTVLYRQHGLNDTGAKHWSFYYVITKALTIFTNTIALVEYQAEAFGKRFGSLLPEEQKLIIDDFVKLHDRGYLSKRVFLYQHKLLKQGIIRNMGLLFRI